MNKIPVGVLGASGYAGRELCALILGHPSLSLSFATANDQRGATVRLAGRDVTFCSPDDASLAAAEMVFSSLPHGTSKEWVANAQAAGCRVVDLSADLRPGNGCEGTTYGLTEVNRASVAASTIVANPGCYPTSILVPLAPLFAQGVIPAGATIVANSASGVTGAGNSPKRELLFAEVVDDYRAYGIGNTHRHLNEMRATLSAWDADADLVFTPHLLPVPRGILSSIVLPVTTAPENVLGLLRDAYAGEPFIEVCADTPALRDVVHRNVVRISVTPLAGTRTPSVLVTSAIDNLVKGAAGQALQNANLMLGLDETAGLPS